MDLRFGQNLVSEVVGEETRRVQIDLASELFAQLNLEASQTQQTHPSLGLELDEDIHVAVGSEVIAEDGPEEGQTAEVVGPAERLDLLIRNVDSCLAHSGILPAGAARGNCVSCASHTSMDKCARPGAEYGLGVLLIGDENGFSVGDSFDQG